SAAQPCVPEGPVEKIDVHPFAARSPSDKPMPECLGMQLVQRSVVKIPPPSEIVNLWFANNTSGIKCCRFSFLAAQPKAWNAECAAAGNMLHGRLLRPRLTCS